MNKEELLKDLINVPEMIPDEHDGSYELMREIVASYATVSDYSTLTIRDLNAIYMMAVGTWKLNVEKKKEYVWQGTLSYDEKSRIVKVIDRIWDNACKGKYSNKEKQGPSVGMFGTGFYSFETKATDKSAQDFIKMLIDLAEMEDDDQIYDRAALVLNRGFRGMKAASASMILHCLKPNTFPILNGNMGKGNIFGALGVNLKRPADIDTYIENCRRIKSFRDQNLPFKNYRILDQWVEKLDFHQDEIFEPSLDEYNPGITSEQYEECFRDESFISKNLLDTIYYLYKIGGEGSCTQIAEKYGNVAQHYNSNAITVARRMHSRTNCPLNNRESEDGNRLWSVLFQGRNARNDELGIYIWRMRKPLADAVETLDEAGFFEDLEMKVNNAQFEHNMILYGPPGTGKTYRTATYAVAICDGKPLDELTDYDAVMSRYNELKAHHRIAFTTFHQSYGYEEFIEGIKPVVDSEKDDVSYTIESGVFKTFCERARVVQQEKDIEYTGTVWAYRNRSGDDDVTPDYQNSLLAEGVIKVEDIQDYKRQCNFISDLAPGDWIVMGRGYYINAIGIVLDDEPEKIEDGVFHYQRRVEWKISGIYADCRYINHGKGFSNFVLSKSRMKIRDLQDIIDGDIKNEQPYVFIIDEINRGNISKVFGELITLIEDTKREGMPETADAILPYSGDSFSVPSNVYILGTMNTADRSIALMDTALRRRFSFIEMMPDSNVLRSLHADKVVSKGQTLDVAAMLDVINERIKYLYDREHTIGHAFFTPLKDDPSIERLASIFEKKVIPLLQEYFYEDYSKIQLVLGDDGKKKDEDKQYQFIRDTEVKTAELFYSVPEMESQNTKYEIQESAFHEIESYKRIGKNL